MNPGQEMFYHFIIDRAKEDQKEAAKLLLEESFGKQADGSFDRVYFEVVRRRFLSLVRPECEAEVVEAMNHFGARL